MSDPSPTSAPAAGWYPDPTEPSVIRWWDGTQWTHHIQPTPQAAPIDTKPPWLTNRTAIAAVLGLIVVLTVIFLVAGGGGDDSESGSDLSSTELESADADAQNSVRLAQVAIETFATDNDGAYQDATEEALTEIEPALTGELTVEASAESYFLTVTSESGTGFSISRSIEGTTTYSCDAPGEGACPESGDWANG